MNRDPHSVPNGDHFDPWRRVDNGQRGIDGCITLGHRNRECPAANLVQSLLKVFYAELVMNCSVTLPNITCEIVPGFRRKFEISVMARESFRSTTPRGLRPPSHFKESSKLDAPLSQGMLPTFLESDEEEIECP